GSRERPSHKRRTQLRVAHALQERLVPPEDDAASGRDASCARRELGKCERCSTRTGGNQKASAREWLLESQQTRAARARGKRTPRWRSQDFGRDRPATAALSATAALGTSANAAARPSTSRISRGHVP